MKKILVAISLFLFLSAGMVSAINFRSATTVDYSVVMADDDASINTVFDGDDEKDKKKKKCNTTKGKKCCSKTGKNAKCSGASKKCCDTKKSCDKSKTATEVKDKDDK
jgi:hypothetical protein